jgi:DNA-binding PucR family transcriptional regulator
VERERFGRRLHDAVTGFVDDPRRSVTEADAVFEEVSRRITELLAERHRGLREPWQGEDAAERTEDLRKALRRYRDAADQLLRL